MVIIPCFGLHNMQTSADKDNESPDTSCSSLSGRAYRQRKAFFGKPDRIETEKIRTDNHRKALKNPDRLLTADRIQDRDRIGTPDKIETDRIRTTTRRRQDTDSAVRRCLIIWKMCQKTWRFDKNLDDVKK